MPYYTYLFTRQDISPEQQIVQAARAAFKLGMTYNNSTYGDAEYAPYIKEPDADQTHFTLIGVRNEEGLWAVQKILTKFGYRYETFYEPDMEFQATSIAVYTIDAEDRDVLMAFNLLKCK